MCAGVWHRIAINFFSLSLFSESQCVRPGKNADFADFADLPDLEAKSVALGAPSLTRRANYTKVEVSEKSAMSAIPTACATSAHARQRPLQRDLTCTCTPFAVEQGSS